MSAHATRISWLITTPLVWVATFILWLLVGILFLTILTIPWLWTFTFDTDPDPPGKENDLLEGRFSI